PRPGVRTEVDSLIESDIRQLGDLLDGFIAEARAHCAVLVDRSGRLLTQAGDTGAMDNITFASLVAGDFAASDQLARLLGEEEFSSLYHAGEGRSMFLADVSGWGILAALFDGHTTLGMIRLRSKTLVPKIATLLHAIATRPRLSEATPGMDENWVSQAEDEIDKLFS
ncbi:MAG TPA: roadblock/LC7 domain-containing protein, partial [Longimicrobiales bacterium]